MQNKKRINRLVWVDIAKAVAIIAMILGHEIGKDKSLHFWIYSFHMPIFFILSGYTSRLVDTWQVWHKQIKKLFIRILVPALLMIFIYQIERVLFKQISWDQVWMISGKELFWGADPVLSSGLSVEIEWFLFLYFFAKLFFDTFNILFKNKNYGIILMILSLASYLFISVHMNLPFVLYLVPLASFYMYVGHLLKSNQIWIQSHYLIIVSAAFIYWGWMILNHQAVDIAIRYFTNNYILGILETITGSFVVIVVCRLVEDFKSMKMFSLLGRHTLMLMFIHELDCFNFTGMYIIQALHFNNYTSGIYRVVMDITILFLFIGVQKGFQILRRMYTTR